MKVYKWDFVTLITAMVMCGRSQDSLLSVSVLRVHVVISTVGFKGGGKPCPKTREIDHVLLTNHQATTEMNLKIQLQKL